MSAYNFNINSYTNEELMGVLKLDPTTITYSKIKKNINNTLKRINKKDNLTENELSFGDFILEVKERLLDYIQNKTNNNRRSNIDEVPDTIDEAHHKIIENNIPVQYSNQLQFPGGTINPLANGLILPPGNINPLAKQTITKVINIDSVFRKNYEKTRSEDYTLELPEKLTKVVSIKIISLEIPNTIYTISERKKTNCFKVTFYNITGRSEPVENIVTIPEGNYLAEDFTIMINNYFTNSGTASNNYLNLIHFEISNIDSKSIFRLKNEHDSENYLIPDELISAQPEYSPDVYFTIDFSYISDNIYDSKVKEQSKSKTLGWFLGFRKSTYTIYKTNTITDSVTSNQINQFITYTHYLKGETSYASTIDNYIFLDINDYNSNEITNTFMSSNGKNYIGDNIIARISIPVLFYNTYYDNITSIFRERNYMGPVNLTKLHLRLLDRYGDVIDLNSNDYSFLLEVVMQY